MKKLVIAIMAAALLSTGCGKLERVYDSANYESLTNEKGTIKLYDGGKLVASYVDAKIIYTSADTDAVYFKTAGGENKYWQGTMLMELN